jgi:hypothetical protein
VGSTIPAIDRSWFLILRFGEANVTKLPSAEVWALSEPDALTMCL